MQSPQPPAPRRPVRVVIVGAGPAGCLAAQLLILRDAPYHVTLVDARPDPTSVPLTQQRSWMIAMSQHGVAAVDRVPGLLEALEGVSLPCQGLKMHVGRRAFTVQEGADGFVVDRNWIIAGMVRHMTGTDAGPERLQCLWKTKCLYVDPEARTLTVKPEGGPNQELEYDLLLGCDGIRSVVRNAFLKDRLFEMELTDCFYWMKSVHVPLPPGLDTQYVHLMPFAMPNINGIILPELNGTANFAGGWAKHQPCAPELRSTDVDVVREYAKAHFQGRFALDWQTFAEQWVAQEWSTLGQVKCSTYHLAGGRCVLLGDAAHATCPAIGQGMNTALDDASKFNDLLDRFEDDLDRVLPAFTELRLKEGHALVELSSTAFSFDPKVQVAITMWQVCPYPDLQHVPPRGMYWDG